MCLVRVLLILPVPTALVGFAWAVKIERFYDAAGWLAAAVMLVWLVGNTWRAIRDW